MTIEILMLCLFLCPIPKILNVVMFFKLGTISVTWVFGQILGNTPDLLTVVEWVALIRFLFGVYHY